MGEQVTGKWRKLHNQKSHNFHPSPKVIKLRTIWWAGHLALMEEMRHP